MCQHSFIHLPYGHFSCDLDSCLTALCLEKAVRGTVLVVCWISLKRKKNKKKTKQALISTGVWSWRFPENHGDDSLACAVWQHDPWSIRGECGWDSLVHVLNVWLHFLILSPFHYFTSSFDGLTVVTVLPSLSFLSKNGASAASVKQTLQLPSCACLDSWLDKREPRCGWWTWLHIFVSLFCKDVAAGVVFAAPPHWMVIFS